MFEVFYEIIIKIAIVGPKFLFYSLLPTDLKVANPVPTRAAPPVDLTRTWTPAVDPRGSHADRLVSRFSS